MGNTPKVSVALLSLPQHQTGSSSNLVSVEMLLHELKGSVLHLLWTLQLIHDGPYSKNQKLILSSHPLSQHAQ